MATQSQIDSKIRIINKLVGTPTDPCNTIDGKTVWNVGSYTYNASGIPCYYTLVRISNESGGIHSISETCSRGMNSFLDALGCFIQGMETIPVSK